MVNISEVVLLPHSFWKYSNWISSPEPASTPVIYYVAYAILKCKHIGCLPKRNLPTFYPGDWFCWHKCGWKLSQHLVKKKKKLNLVLCPLTCPETVLTSCWKYHVNTISSSWHELQLIHTESLISMYETYKSNRFLVCSNIQCQCFIQLGFFLFFLDANQIVFENCKDENSYQGKLMLNWHFIKK